ncbi:hypothetical protein M1K46_16515 [Fictibacillus sp. WQ 8-8]|uniref:hypothetical protein n=1 Tax=unclassified Fictibacillus TaxID=2644029 RepID=UPI0006A79ED9|nr:MULTISPECIES: hypothetical protein [unclassified Fictibacillus]MCQ6267241.1 hypothetical protein [Fictibacillus sp. WQ 8-8]MED2973109.1 hypothetical protein [Fictibacillus sp. B-59209]UZJ76968.1 hypothetical protein OKX00_12165 [Fictibacillus sp. KU28468]SFD91710.1 hypothetical protein SAMN05428981_102311 [Bacillus sp. OV194]
MSKKAKIVFVISTLVFVIVLFSSIQRENTRKENLKAMGDYFNKKFELDEDLKSQYDNKFKVKVGKERYIVTLKNKKVVSAKKES